MPIEDKPALAAAAQKALARLAQNCPGLKWATVATKDGAEVASHGSSADEKLSVMTGTMHALADGIVDAFVHVCEQYLTYPVGALVQDGYAEAVMKAVVAQGIDAKRLNAVGRGQTQPVADNGSDSGRAKNRRVELVKK